MKINFRKAVNAPFKVSGEESLGRVYLIAGLVCFGTLIVSIIGQFITQGLSVVIESVSAHDANPGMVGFIGAIFILLVLVISALNILAYSMPFGYILETVKNEISNKEIVMSDWKGNYLKFFLFGLKGQLLLLVYYLIYILIPTIIVSIPIIFAATSNSSTLKTIGAPIFIVFIALLILWTLGISVIFPMVIVRYAITGSFISNLNILLPIKNIIKNIADYIITIILLIAFMIIYSIAASALVCCTCGLGILLIPIVSGFVVPIIILNIFAQIYKD